MLRRFMRFARSGKESNIVRSRVWLIWSAHYSIDASQKGGRVLPLFYIIQCI